jgi:hypothetical protein
MFRKFAKIMSLAIYLYSDLLVKDFLEILATSEIFSSGEASGTSDIILRYF